MSRENSLIKEINYLTNLIRSHQRAQWPPPLRQPSRPPYHHHHHRGYWRGAPAPSHSRYKYVAGARSTQPPVAAPSFRRNNVYKLNRIGARKIASNREKLKINNFKMRLVRLKGKIYEVAVKKLKSTSGNERRVVSLKKPTKHISLANRMVARSRMVLAARHKKVNESCMFYTRYGRCVRGTQCRYVHDPARVAVCRKFLKGKCTQEGCLLSHTVCPSKMPTCTYFLRGRCSSDKCPYSHVSVNPKAPPCPQFLKGYCPLQDKCQKRHELPKRKKTMWKPPPKSSSSPSTEQPILPQQSAMFPNLLPSFIPISQSPLVTSEKPAPPAAVKIRPSFILPPPN